MSFKFLKEPCPNCESAWTGGHPNPDGIVWCIVCSDPETGELRGWVWRWTWLHNLLVMNKNVRLWRNQAFQRGMMEIEAVIRRVKV